MAKEEKTYKAALVVIGNEILSGRTQDKNINYIAGKLVERGIALVEVRVIPDIEDKIIATIKSLKPEVDYILTTGGIGPTHDDITAECIAKAFGVPFEMNPQAFEILEKHYGAGEFTPARQKMAMIPKGAALIANPVSAAPGFIVNDVYVMAGVPRIMQAMLDDILPKLQGGAVVRSLTVSCDLPESRIAIGLGEVQKKWPEVDIGSYPFFQDGKIGVSIVLRCAEDECLVKAGNDVRELIENIRAQTNS